jgi:hypothetical protein
VDPACQFLQPELSSLARSPSHVFQQVAAIERLYQEGNSPVLQCLLAKVIVIMGCDQDDRQLTPFPSNPPLKFRPVHAGQTHVCDDARNARKRARQQKCFRGFEADGFVSGGFKDVLDGFSNTTIVVDRCDDHIRLGHQNASSCMRRIVRTARPLG